MEKQKILQEIKDRQFNKNFDDTKFIIFDIEYGGFGAMLARRKLALQFGCYFNRTVILNYTNYAYDEPFVQISKFTIDDISNYPIVEFNFQNDQEDKVVKFNFIRYWNDVEKRTKYHELSVGNLSFIEFSGLLLNFLELNEIYKNKLTKKINKFNTDSSFLGVHIRRGDKEVESPFIPLSKYVDEIQKICEKNKFKKVFVTSDSEETIIKLIQLIDDKEIFFDKEELRHNTKESNLNVVLNNKTLKEVETFTFIKNLELLSNCGYILGQSNVQMVKISICKKMDKINSVSNYTLINPFTLREVNWDN